MPEDLGGEEVAQGEQPVSGHPLPKKGKLKLCESNCTISLISHPRKAMLRILLNRVKSKAEQLLTEEQAGFRPGRSTVQHLFNCSAIMEKHLDGNSCRAVLLNGQKGDLFTTTLDDRQGCQLSAVMFNLFIKKIMQEILQDHRATIYIGGRPSPTWDLMMTLTTLVAPAMNANNPQTNL